jgi:ribonuclease E
MAKKMLIDATHPEETRVVVLNGNRLEEFDFESSTKAQIKGNIYLAKVTRVEPSLQAAFVEYGGNRHGFLAFNEIHPDYYRIPVADREALIAEAASARGRDDDAFDTELDDGHHADGDGQSEVIAEEIDQPERWDNQSVSETESGGDPESNAEDGNGAETEERTDRPRRARRLRSYKIQEVIARRQIMLVQVVKEERGNKGAALTTYISLAGRYCVLMPNTPRGGGVSRKISSVADRKRLKSMLDEFGIPEGMAIIVRTAGMERSKTEVRRDYEYLIRLWDDIRELTLKSTAPAMIHAEGDLIKRAIRDLYARDIDEVLVEGDEGYRVAKTFMKMLVPSHAKKVQQYRDVVPLMHRYQVEAQLDAIHSPSVQLKSGGYIVINSTEALVAIDVNSGRATRERDIEETALKTNLEAADEIGRQLRLRDLAGLIVVDFIDMEERRHNGAVEKRIKEAMKLDRARIQVGHISSFGLLELSRQRLRPSLFEASTEICPHCAGTGSIRSIESTSLHVLRAIEDEGLKGKTAEMAIYVPTQVALYMLNQKRQTLLGIEARYGMSVQVANDDTLIPPALRIERLRARLPGEFVPQMQLAPAISIPEIDDEVEDDILETEIEVVRPARAEGRPEPRRDEERGGNDEAGRKRRRRRRRRRVPGEEGSGEEASGEEGVSQNPTSNGTAALVAPESDGSDPTGDEGDESTPRMINGVEETPAEAEARRRRRRGRRGGRRRRRFEGDGAENGVASAEAVEDTPSETFIGPMQDTPKPVQAPDLRAIAERIERALEAEALEAPRYRSRFAAPAPVPAPVAEPAPVVEAVPVIPEPMPEAVPTAEVSPVVPAADAETPAAEDSAPKAKAPRRRKKADTTVPPAEEPAALAAVVPESSAPVEEAPKPKRTRRKVAVAETAPDPVPEPAPEPFPEPAPMPVQAAEPVAVMPPEEPPTPKSTPGVDIIAVDAPPENPRKGWWRRG